MSYHIGIKQGVLNNEIFKICQNNDDFILIHYNSFEDLKELLNQITLDIIIIDTSDNDNLHYIHCIEKLKTDFKTKHIPILLIIDHQTNSNKNKEKLLTCGVDAFLDIHETKNIIENIIEFINFYGKFNSSYSQRFLKYLIQYENGENIENRMINRGKYIARKYNIKGETLSDLITVLQIGVITCAKKDNTFDNIIQFYKKMNFTLYPLEIFKFHPYNDLKSAIFYSLYNQESNFPLNLDFGEYNYIKNEIEEIYKKDKYYIDNIYDYKNIFNIISKKFKKIDNNEYKLLIKKFSNLVLINLSYNIYLEIELKEDDYKYFIKIKGANNIFYDFNYQQIDQFVLDINKKIEQTHIIELNSIFIEEEDLIKLSDLELEMMNQLDNLLIDKLDIKIIKELITLINQYALILSQIKEVENVTFEMFSLFQILNKNNLKKDRIENNINNILTLLNSFIKNIEEWKYIIFIQKIKDIEPYNNNIIHELKQLQFFIFNKKNSFKTELS